MRLKVQLNPYVCYSADEDFIFEQSLKIGGCGFLKVTKIMAQLSKAI